MVTWYPDSRDSHDAYYPSIQGTLNQYGETWLLIGADNWPRHRQSGDTLSFEVVYHQTLLKVGTAFAQ
jgi:hypothetical protein